MLAEVDSGAINDGSSSRANVVRLTLRFGQLVLVDAGACRVWQRGALGGEVDVSVSLDHTTGQTVATLTFSGGFVEDSGSLMDGNYELRIDSTKVRSLGNGYILDGDEDGAAGGQFLFGAKESDAFFRFFGDIDGSRTIDFLDFYAFRTTFGASAGEDAFDARFDWDNDGDIDFLDFYHFRGRFGLTLDFE